MISNTVKQLEVLHPCCAQGTIMEMHSRDITGDPQSHPQHKRNGTACPSYVNCCLQSEVSITLHCQLCYRPALQIKNSIPVI